MTSVYLQVLLALHIFRFCCRCEPCICCNKTYQGIIADCSRKNFTELEDVVTQLHCSHQNLENSTDINNFSSFQTLNEFWADSSNIYDIQPGAFHRLSNLTILSLRYNFLEKLGQNMFQGLNNLIELRLEGNMIQIIKQNSFTFLMNLTYLHLDNNEIYKISNLAFKGLHNLKCLSLSHNFIYDLAPQAFHDLHNLITLKLNGNNLTSLDERIFEKQVKLKFMRLDYNFITNLSSCVFSNLKSLTHINMNNNFLNNLEFLINRLNKSETSQCPSGSPLESLSKLIKLQLHGNRIQNIDRNEFKYLFNLKFLDISSNKLTKLHPNTFFYNSFLNTLHLSNNPELEILKSVPFLNSTVLKILNLSQCRIRELSKNSFKFLPELKEIYLDGNWLNSFNEDILLNLINLTNLTLFNNPLICSCELKQTWKWCLSQNINLTERKPHCLKSENIKKKTWDEFQNIKCETSFYVILKHIVEPIVFAIIFFLDAIGTGALLLIFCYYEKILETPNSCIFSMTLGDFIIVMVYLPINYTYALTTTWKSGIGICKIFMFIRDLIIGLTVFSVLMLSFHRYTLNISKYKTRNSVLGSYSKTALLHLFVIWCTAICLSLPALISAAIDEESCMYASEDTGITFIHRVTITQFTVYIALPLCFIVLIHFVTKRHITLTSLTHHEKVNNERAKARREVVKNILSLTLVFLITYTPDLLMRVLIGWSIVNNLSDSVKFFIFLTECLYFSNAWLNPLALYFTCNVYKQHFRRIMYCERFRKRSFKRKPTLVHTISSGVSEQ